MNFCGFLAALLSVAAFGGFVNLKGAVNVQAGQYCFLTISFCMGSLAVACRWASGRIAQYPRDRWVKRLPEALDRGENPAFTLFLRPFVTTGRLVIEAKPLGPLSITGRLRSPHEQFEYQLFQALDRGAPVVCLGIPGEAVGAARLQTDEKAWKGVLHLLATKARAIVCIPSHRQGTAWEVALLQREQMLEKTVLCMPWSSPRLDVPAEWEYTRRSLGEAVGLILPTYERNGALLTAYRDGSQERHRSLRRGDQRSLREALGDLLPDGCT